MALMDSTGARRDKRRGDRGQLFIGINPATERSLPSQQRSSTPQRFLFGQRGHNNSLLDCLEPSLLF